MRISVEYRSNSKEVYKKFCLKYPEVKITFDKWIEVLKTFNHSFRDYVLETGDRAKLPWGFGDFAISKKKVKREKTAPDGKVYINLPIDWQKTKETGKRVYQFNSHTDGYRCKWFWFNSEARFFASDIWVFKPSRESSRKIAEYLKKQSTNYLDLYKIWG